MNRQKIFKLFSIALMLWGSMAFAQSAPSRNDASAEYCISPKQELRLVNVIQPLPSISIGKSETLCCDSHGAGSWTRFQLPGAFRERTRCNLKNMIYLGSTTLYSSLKSKDSLMETTKTEKKTKNSSNCKYPARYSFDFYKEKGLQIPDSAHSEEAYIQNLYGKMFPVETTILVTCRGPKMRTTLKQRYFIRITGPCPDSILNKK
jgi:hypothetical protein